MTDKTQALLPVTRHPTQVKGNCPTCGRGQSHSLPGRSEWMNLMPREVVARAALGEGCRDETADNIRYGFHRDVKIRAEVAVKLVASIQDDVRAALTPSATMEGVMRAAAISSSEHRYDASALSGDAGEVRGLRALLQEFVEAMERYQMDVDGDATPRHRDMMARGRSALAGEG